MAVGAFSLFEQDLMVCACGYSGTKTSSSWQSLTRPSLSMKLRQEVDMTMKYVFNP